MSEETPVHSHPASILRVALAVLMLAIVAAGAYSWRERGVAKQLAKQNSAMSSALSATHDQLTALTAKVNALEESKASPDESKPRAAIYRKPVTAAVARHRMEDPRWKKMQGQLDDQGRQIESTRQDLSNARTELQGSIAKTHDELVVLEKKGERNYYEFDVDKTGQFQRQGPVSIRLRKANTKHEYADLELLVDDLKVSKKHVNVYEPVVFYPGNDKLPVELVINTISRDHIHGYVSEPKYRGADLNAMANPGVSSQSSATTAEPNHPGAAPALRRRDENPATQPNQ